MRIIVQKFGGTSVATPEGRQAVVRRVKQAVDDGYATVVVVSAMGRQGDPYATDTLIQMAQSASPDLAPRDMDLLLSCGEIISSVLMAATLTAAGIPAVALTGGQAGIQTDNNYGNAQIVKVDPAPVLSRLREGLVVVVAGFQGVNAAGEVTTLGRGGSDTTAAALGGVLRAEVVEIYTDVDGVKTADPRLVAEARTLAVTTYDEIAQMAHYGAKVVHPRAVEIAMQHRVPIRVRSTFSDSPGTLITYSAEAGVSWSEPFSDRVVTAVTHQVGLAQVVVKTGRDWATPRLFRRLANAGISVDLISVSMESSAFSIPEARAAQAEMILTELGLVDLQVRHGCAKVTVVGSGMRGRPGVMATVAEALYAAEVPIWQTADSHVTISCLVPAADVQRAVKALHDAFELGRE